MGAKVAGLGAPCATLLHRGRDRPLEITRPNSRLAAFQNRNDPKSAPKHVLVRAILRDVLRDILRDISRDILRDWPVTVPSHWPAWTSPASAKDRGLAPKGSAKTCGNALKYHTHRRPTLARLGCRPGCRPGPEMGPRTAPSTSPSTWADHRVCAHARPQWSIQANVVQ